MDSREIVVGVDGSRCSTIATHWAAREAARRNVPLRVLMAHDTPWPGIYFGGESGLPHLTDREAQHIVDAAAASARESAPDVEVNTQTVVGWAVASLLATAEDASLLVVGSRGLGGFSSLMLGSVSHQVASHAHCPVTVVRGQAADDEGPVIVGADGSARSQDAVGLAFQLAHERGTRLVAVRAYYPPMLPFGFGFQSLIYELDVHDPEEQVKLHETVKAWQGKYPDVAVDEVVAHGGAARTLVGLSHRARLVVVGSRGHGSFVGTMLGSVGLQLAHHAECPVVIARV